MTEKRKRGRPRKRPPTTTRVEMPAPRVFDLPGMGQDAEIPRSEQIAADGRPVGDRANNNWPSQKIYNPSFALVAREMCRMGATDMNLADAFGVNQRTIDAWRVTYKEFRVAMRVGRKIANELVERSLFQRAVGYEVEDVKVFMPANCEVPVVVPIRVRVPADVKAQALWLMNREPDKWHQELKVQTAVSVVVKNYTMADGTATATASIEQAVQPQLPSPPEGSDQSRD